MHNLGSETKRAAGSPLWGAIGQIGSILGSHLYPLTDGPAYLCVAPCTLFTIALTDDHRRGFEGTFNFVHPNDVDVHARRCCSSSYIVSGVLMFLAAFLALVLTVRRLALITLPSFCGS